jgi:hypothetical protein
VARVAAGDDGRAAPTGTTFQARASAWARQFLQQYKLLQADAQGRTGPAAAAADVCARPITVVVPDDDDDDSDGLSGSSDRADARLLTVNMAANQTLEDLVAQTMAHGSAAAQARLWRLRAGRPVQPMCATPLWVTRGRLALADAQAGPFRWGPFATPDAMVHSAAVLSPVRALSPTPPPPPPPRSILGSRRSVQVNATLAAAALRYRWTARDLDRVRAAVRTRPYETRSVVDDGVELMGPGMGVPRRLLAVADDGDGDSVGISDGDSYYSMVGVRLCGVCGPGL